MFDWSRFLGWLRQTGDRTLPSQLKKERSHWLILADITTIAGLFQTKL